MIRTLSTASSNSSCSSNEHQSASRPPLPSNRQRRFSLHSLARRLSDSKKNFLEQIPHHQQQLTRFGKRATGFLSSTLVDPLSEIHSAPSERRNSTAGVHISTRILRNSRRRISRHKFLHLDHQRR